MSLLRLLVGGDPEPMSAQDLQDWGASADAQSAVSGRKGKTPENIIAKGQAAVDVTNARKGKK